MLDLLLINGQYPDFDSGEMKSANIGAADGKIAYIGGETPEAAKILDVSGCVVSPGFIYIHMHEENFKDEGESYVIAQMMLEMGVTTAVGGNCGIQKQDLSYFKKVLERLGGSPVNYIMLAGYNQMRYKLGIPRYETATKEQREEIRALLRRELDEGAYGVSFGIEYDPASPRKKCWTRCRSADDPHLLAAAHYREDCLTSIDSVTEMIEIAEKIPMKFQISHLSSCSAMGFMEESLDVINRAMEENPRLNYDTYPYNCFFHLHGIGGL